jgi:hypothetical protein
MATILTLAVVDPEFHRSGIMITVGAALAGMAFGRLSLLWSTNEHRSIPTGFSSW